MIHRMRTSTGVSRKAFLLMSILVAALAGAIAIALPAWSSDSAALREQSNQAGSPSAGELIPDYAFKAAGGRIDRKSFWGVWLFGRAGQNCWATKTSTRGIPFGEAYCGYAVPPAYWRLIWSIPVGKAKRTQSTMFFLTRQDVDKIAVLVRRTKDRPDIWVSTKTRTLSSERASKSRMRLNFSYAVAVFPGSLFCVREIEMFNKSDSQMAKVKPACIGPKDPVKENFE
jgi:hypothetical protein